MVLLLVSGVSQKAVIFLIYFLSAPHSSINQNLLKLAFGLMLHGANFFCEELCQVSP